LPVLNANGLRPSGDRLRETLFNWLQFDLAESRCLDLFAGSGALGLEAASRGAQHVDLIEAHATVAENLVKQVRILEAQDSVQVYHREAQKHLETQQAPYDVVFIDPPFETACQEQLMAHLKNSDLLAADARVYVESPSSQSLPDPVEGYDLLRSICCFVANPCALTQTPTAAAAGVCLPIDTIAEDRA